MKSIKKLLIPLLIILSCVSCNMSKEANEKKDTPDTPQISISSDNTSKIPDTIKNTITKLEEEGFVVIDEQSFWKNLKNWGKVRFVTGYSLIQNLPELGFYLVDEEGNILYKLPKFEDYGAVFFDVTAVSFHDINKDGFEDIIVIADYMRGQGENSGALFPIANIYFQKDKEFVQIPELDKQINDLKKNENIDMILKFVEGKNIKFN